MTNVVSSAPIGVGATFATVTILGVEYPVNIICKADGTIIDPTTTTVSGTVAVTGVFFQATQPVSAAALPLPAGAATSAKQPALGTAGAASADVISVQGIAGGVAQPTALVAGAPVTTVMQAAAIAVGNGATLDVNGFSTTIVELSGTFVATVTFEASIDDVSWTAISAVQTGTTNIASTATGIGIFRLSTAGIKSLRARISSYTSGAVTANGRSIVSATTPKVVSLATGSTISLAAGANVIGGVTQSGTWNVGSITTLPALVAGAAIIGKVGIDQTTPGTTNAVSLAASVPATTTMQSAAVAVGNGTSLDVNGFATTIIELSGTFVATIAFEASIDDVTWNAISAVQTGTTSLSSTATTIGLFRLSTAGIKSIRARISAYTSGSVTAKGRSIVGATAPKIVNLASGATVALAAGSAIAGKVGIDQTTVGTTNAVSLAQIGATTIATGNGVVGTGVQRVSIASDTTMPPPADATASGNITTQNLVPAGAATAGSAVEIALNSQNQIAVQVTGTYTGALSCQVTVDGSTWVTLTGNWFFATTLNGSSTISSGTVGIFSVNVAGYAKARITGLSAMTGTAAVTIRASMGVNNQTIGAGAASIGSVTLAATTALVGDVGVQYRANATGAATVAKILTAATTNATSVKASAGRLLGWSLVNTTAAVKAVHFHNLAVAPTVGTSVPLFTIILPPNASNVFTAEGGIAMATGISYSITAAIADLDATATAVGDVIGVLTYA